MRIKLYFVEYKYMHCVSLCVYVSLHVVFIPLRVLNSPYRSLDAAMSGQTQVSGLGFGFISRQLWLPFTQLLTICFDRFFIRLCVYLHLRAVVVFLFPFFCFFSLSVRSISSSLCR